MKRFFVKIFCVFVAIHGLMLGSYVPETNNWPQPKQQPAQPFFGKLPPEPRLGQSPIVRVGAAQPPLNYIQPGQVTPVQLPKALPSTPQRSNFAAAFTEPTTPSKPSLTQPKQQPTVQTPVASAQGLKWDYADNLLSQQTGVDVPREPISAKVQQSTSGNLPYARPSAEDLGAFLTSGAAPAAYSGTSPLLSLPSFNRPSSDNVGRSLSRMERSGGSATPTSQAKGGSSLDIRSILKRLKESAKKIEQDVKQLVIRDLSPASGWEKPSPLDRSGRSPVLFAAAAAQSRSPLPQVQNPLENSIRYPNTGRSPDQDKFAQSFRNDTRGRPTSARSVVSPVPLDQMLQEPSPNFDQDLLQKDHQAYVEALEILKRISVLNNGIPDFLNDEVKTVVTYFVTIINDGIIDYQQGSHVFTVQPKYTEENSKVFIDFQGGHLAGTCKKLHYYGLIKIEKEKKKLECSYYVIVNLLTGIVYTKSEFPVDFTVNDIKKFIKNFNVQDVNWQAESFTESACVAISENNFFVKIVRRTVDKSLVTVYPDSICSDATKDKEKQEINLTQSKVNEQRDIQRKYFNTSVSSEIERSTLSERLAKSPSLSEAYRAEVPNPGATSPVPITSPVILDPLAKMQAVTQMVAARRLEESASAETSRPQDSANSPEVTFVATEQPRPTLTRGRGGVFGGRGGQGGRGS